MVLQQKKRKIAAERLGYRFNQMPGEPGVILIAHLTRKDQTTSTREPRITINYPHTAVVVVYFSWNKPQCTTEAWDWGR